jgi:hypothetical protein
MILLNSSDIEAIIMESVNERTKEFILRCIGRSSGEEPWDAQMVSAERFGQLELHAAVHIRSSKELLASSEGSSRGRMASQAYRSVAVLGQERS